MEKIQLGTPDITAENIERLGELFPQVLTEVENAEGRIERAVDFDALRDLLGDVAEGTRERYQFTWPGKREAKAEARRPITKTMRPVKEDSVNWDTTQNLYIEGDNLDALKILRETYAGKVKLIYIDPPYNTGHDFVYDDDYAVGVDEYAETSGEYDEERGRLVSNLESNGRFHSDWCSMMYPRLLAARDLLSADGVIFISIDDNEARNLKNICDEVFGATNFMAQIVWQKRTSPDMRKRFSTGHEYLLAYLKTEGTVNASINLLPLMDSDKEAFKNPDNDPRGPWVSSDYTAQGFRPNQMYAITTPSGAVYTPPEGTCWKNVESEYLSQAAEGRFWYGTEGSGMPRRKTYLNEKDGRNCWTWWSNKEVGHTQEATKEFKALFSDAPNIFDFPKPTRLIARIVSLATKEDDIVLDFFSGSASTAHAVLRQQIEDKTKRKFLLVQIPEPTEKDSASAKAGYNTVCEIGKERIRRAGRKIAAEVEEANRQLKLGEESKPVPDIGFRVLRIESSNFNDATATPEETAQDTLFAQVDNIKEGRTALDLLFEVLPKFRIPYSAKIDERIIGGKQCFVVEDGQLIACFDAQVGTETIEQIAKMQPLYAVLRDASLENDATFANFEELFKTYSPDTIRRVI